MGAFYTLEFCIVMGRMEMGFLEIRIPEVCTVTGWSEFGIFGISSSGSTWRLAW